MTESTLKEAKSFRNQMGFCSVFAFVAYAFICYINPKGAEAVIMPIAGLIFGIIYLNMRGMIRKYENSNK